jgi:glutathione S-transferase
MELFFAPLSCSMATRIALYESGQDAKFTQVTLSNKTTADGRDYWGINPTGQVPALLTDDMGILAEGPAVLQYVADRAPAAGLAPAAGTPARYKLQQWLNYISTEVHKSVFAQIFNPATPPETKEYARKIIGQRYDRLSKHLDGREFLLDQFTVADAYLVTTLGWTDPAGIDLKPWPVLVAYRDRLRQRPSVAKAIGEEMRIAGRA